MSQRTLQAGARVQEDMALLPLNLSKWKGKQYMSSCSQRDISSPRRELCCGFNHVLKTVFSLHGSDIKNSSLLAISGGTLR